MMDALGAFVIVAPIAFALGWYARGFTDRHLKGITMKKKTKAEAARFLDWLGHPRKLTVLVVVTAVAVLSSIIYTWSADQQSEDRTDEVVACVQAYVTELSKSNLPRTVASVQASDARRDWDRGYSEDEDARDLSKAQLKVRYLKLYGHYVGVRAGNPLPEFSRAFCEKHLR